MSRCNRCILLYKQCAKLPSQLSRRNQLPHTTRVSRLPDSDTDVIQKSKFKRSRARAQQRTRVPLRTGSTHTLQQTRHTRTSTRVQYYCVVRSDWELACACMLCIMVCYDLHQGVNCRSAMSTSDAVRWLPTDMHASAPTMCAGAEAGRA